MSRLDLAEAAHALMRQHGFLPDFPPDVEQEVQSLPDTLPQQASERIEDLRALPWSSIDNPESRDLDQVEYAERLPDGTIRLLIAIADVDALVPAGCFTDDHAGINTTSVYTGVIVFPMLPKRLSTDLTSLNESEDRLAVVTEFRVDSAGVVSGSVVYRALVRNHAKLDYATVGTWLDGSELPADLAGRPELQQQVRWQDEAAQRLEVVRREAGALNIETIEARPVMQGGKIVDLAVVTTNRARDLIENFMVTANVAMAEFLADRRVPAIRRVVRVPRRWDRIVEIAAEMDETLPPEPSSKALSDFMARRKAIDPASFPDLSLTVVKLLGAGEYTLERRFDARRGAGHFGLAVAEYAHSTAPNRRYPDLINQRLAKAVLNGQPAPYTDQTLHAIAQRCSTQEDAARKVERSMRKKAAAVLMANRVGDSFPAIVTGASEKGTYVRLLRPPVEGRLIGNTRGLDVGVTVRVRLARVDIERGYIDFETDEASRDRKLERHKRKKAAAAKLQSRVGEVFPATVTGVTDKGIWVRTNDGVEGRVMRGFEGLTVGQSVKVQLIRADAVHGFIDFQRAGTN
ncbi:MAG: RNB domain-containing ribonuclease [Gemmatimonadota bacterium]